MKLFRAVALKEYYRRAFKQWKFFGMGVAPPSPLVGGKRRFRVQGLWGGILTSPRQGIMGFNPEVTRMIGYFHPSL